MIFFGQEYVFLGSQRHLEIIEEAAKDGPQAEDMNHRFAEIGSILGIEIPYYFIEGSNYSQQEININLDTILMALRQKSWRKK